MKKLLLLLLVIMIFVTGCGRPTIEEVATVYGYKMMKTACIEEVGLYSCNFEEYIGNKM